MKKLLWNFWGAIGSNCSYFINQYSCLGHREPLVVIALILVTRIHVWIILKFTGRYWKASATVLWSDYLSWISRKERFWKCVSLEGTTRRWVNGWSKSIVPNVLLICYFYEAIFLNILHMRIFKYIYWCLKVYQRQ